MAKILRMKNIEHELIVFTTGIPHGFLNMFNLVDETRDASRVIYSVLEKIFVSDKID